MNNTIMIIVKKNENEARVAEQELKVTGFQTTLSVTKKVVWDSMSFGRGQDTLNNLDDEIFVVIGSR